MIKNKEDNGSDRSKEATALMDEMKYGLIGRLRRKLNRTQLGYLITRGERTSRF